MSKEIFTSATPNRDVLSHLKRVKLTTTEDAVLFVQLVSEKMPQVQRVLRQGAQYNRSLESRLGVEESRMTAGADAVLDEAPVQQAGNATEVGKPAKTEEEEVIAKMKAGPVEVSSSPEEQVAPTAVKTVKKKKKAPKKKKS